MKRQNLPVDMKRVNYNSPYEIFCLTDCREESVHSMNQEIKEIQKGKYEKGVHE